MGADHQPEHKFKQPDHKLEQPGHDIDELKPVDEDYAINQLDAYDQFAPYNGVVAGSAVQP